MENKKITIAENFDKVIAFLKENEAPQDLIDFTADRKEKSIKKSNGKPSKTAEENESLAINVMNVLAEIKSGTVSEIQAVDPVLAPLPNQKVSAVLKMLKERGEVDKATVKGRSVFSIATAEPTVEVELEDSAE